MRCDEIQERFVDLLYCEPGTPSPDAEVQAHLGSCRTCQKDLAELRDLQKTLSSWQDEPPLLPVAIPRTEPVRPRFRVPVWHIFRYAAIAALVLLAFLSVTNAQINWNDNGFSFRTSLFSRSTHGPDSPITRDELRNIIRNVQIESHNDNYQMNQNLLDTIDQYRNLDYRRLANMVQENRRKN